MNEPIEGTKKRVAAYCRVSTAMELQEGSFDQQMSYYQALIQSDPTMELVGVYGDKGRSGRSVEARPEFRRMLSDCEAGRIDLILTKSMSRFARNLGDCIATLRRLKELGVTVRFEKENLDSSQAQGELMLSIFAAMAQEESNSISQSMLWSIDRQNSSGKPCFKPSYGYVKARRDWEWHIDEAQARRVRKAFELAAGGACYSELRRALNEMERVERTGVDWTHRRLRYMLTNVNYTGDCLTNRYVAAHCGGRRVRENDGARPQYYIKDHHEPLVSREVFDAVQERISSGALNSRDMSRLNGGTAR